MSRKRLIVNRGEIYNCLIILKEVAPYRGERFFHCKCKCGNKTVVRISQLRNGQTKSCGCLVIEANRRPEVVKKIKDAHNKRVFEGKNNIWKGELASYSAKHMWIRKHYGKASKCENKDCKYPRYNSKGVLLEKPTKYHWANLTGKFRDIKDYKQLCHSCHKKLDMGIIKV